MLFTAFVAMCSVRTLEDGYADLETFHRPEDRTISTREYLDVLRLPASLLCILCVMLNVVTDIFVLITLTGHLQQFNLTTMQIGFIYLCLFLSYGISSPLAGKIADLTGKEFLLQFFGSLIILVSFLIIGPSSLINIKSDLKLVIAGLLLKGKFTQLLSCFTVKPTSKTVATFSLLFEHLAN